MFYGFIAIFALTTLACTAHIDSSGQTTDPAGSPRPSNEGTLGGGEKAPGGGPSGAVAGPLGMMPPGTGPGGGPAVVAGSGPIPAGPLEDRPGPRPLRRLSRDELNNTLRDLLGDTSSPANVLPADSHSEDGFEDAGPVATIDVEYLLQMADRAGRTAATKVATLVACDPVMMGEQVCAQRFVTRFGRRAFRRPLADSEVTALVGYFSEVKTTLKAPFAEAVRMVIEAILVSPNFLYHWELGAGPARTEGDLVRLSPHETAARLSYFLWRSMPDDALFASVDAGKLTTPADVEREALRMLKDTRARQMAVSFHVQWLGLDLLPQSPKDTKVFTGFGLPLANAMVEESADFAARTLLEGDGSFKSLLLSTSASVGSTVDGPLAKLYGLQAGATGTVTLDPAQRAGLLTRAAFLAVKAAPSASHPVKRGHKVYTGLLCGAVPPPPEMVTTPKAPPANVSTRESFAAHSANACAAGCHALFDSLGFAFENYDAFGRYRVMDGGKTVDATGALRTPSDGTPQPFANAVELMNLLAVAPDARACMVRQWMRFALGRLEVPGDDASWAGIVKGFNMGDGDQRAALVALSRSRSFLYRSPSAGEVVQ